MTLNSRRQFFVAASALVGMAVLSVGAAGCCGASKKPLAGTATAYEGHWVGTDGSFVKIAADGSGDCKIGATSVTGGNVFIEGTKMTFGLGPITKDLTIDTPPATADGHSTMKLSGIVYTKS